MADNIKATANGSHGADDADLAKVRYGRSARRKVWSADSIAIQAFQELAKGESTAAALENQLGAMEAKIEAMLAQAEKDQQAIEQAKKRQKSVETSESTQTKGGSSSS